MKQAEKEPATGSTITITTTTGAGAGGSRMRDAAVDAPAVGKLRNGMLQLSKKDVQSIQGGGDGRRGAAAGGGKRRRR